MIAIGLIFLAIALYAVALIAITGPGPQYQYRVVRIHRRQLTYQYRVERAKVDSKKWRRVGRNEYTGRSFNFIEFEFRTEADAFKKIEFFKKPKPEYKEPKLTYSY